MKTEKGEMRLAICVPIKNRSQVVVDRENSVEHLPEDLRNNLLNLPAQFHKKPETKDGKIVLRLFPTMVQSLLELKRPEDDWHLVVVDYNSTDINMREFLEREVGDKMGWHLEEVKDYRYFDRGGGLKRGFEIAKNRIKADTVFFCDADLLFTNRQFFEEMETSVSRGQYFYPVFFSFYDPEHSKGMWRDTSFGNFACRIEDYEKTEGWYHNISWGWEDRALADSISDVKKDRKRIMGFFHQWHPVAWEFRVAEYPEKEYKFIGAAVKELPLPLPHQPS